MTLEEFKRLVSDHKWWLERQHPSDAPTEWLRVKARLLSPAQKRCIQHGWAPLGSTSRVLREQGLLNLHNVHTELGRHVQDYLREETARRERRGR